MQTKTDNNVLRALYDEYEVLAKKLDALKITISLMGGRLPKHLKDTDYLLHYPHDSSITQKLMYMFRSHPNIKFTVGEIIDKMKVYDPQIWKHKVTITQYCSQLAASGAIEVLRGYKNKYWFQEGEPLTTEETTMQEV